METVKILNYTGAPITMGVKDEQGKFSGTESNITFPVDGKAILHHEDVENDELIEEDVVAYSVAVELRSILAESSTGKRTVLWDWPWPTPFVVGLPSQKHGQLIIVTEEVYNVLGHFRDDLRIIDTKKNCLKDPYAPMRGEYKGERMRELFGAAVLSLATLRLFPERLMPSLRQEWIEYLMCQAWFIASRPEFWGSGQHYPNFWETSYPRPTCSWSRKKDKVVLILQLPEGPKFWEEVDKDKISPQYLSKSRVDEPEEEEFNYADVAYWAIESLNLF